MSDIRLIMERGFTLVELAMVLLIIGLLLGGLLMPLATQVEQRDRRLVQQQLEDIKRALLGYAVINKRLPCATLETDPTDDDYGISDTSNCAYNGILPWKTLGIEKTDPWGAERTNNSDPWDGYWHYRVDRNFVDGNFDLETTPDEDLEVYDSKGNKLTASNDDTPVFIIYSTGPDGDPDGENSLTPQNHKKFQGGIPQGDDPDDSDYFDDITAWMTRPILLSTMISARQLPDD